MGIKKIPSYYQKIKAGQKKWFNYLKRREYMERYGIGYFILEFLTNEDGRNFFIERFYPKVLDKKNKILFYLSE